MKKILILMFFIFCLFTPCIKVYASPSTDVTNPLVCTVGYDYSYLLEYEGYKIISKTVDFNNVGTYFVSYLNNTTKETLIKRVEVIEENSVFSSGYVQYNQVKLASPEYKIVDSFTYNDATYLLEVETVCENEHNLILSKVENNKICFTKTLKQNICATFNKLLIDDDGIYIVGTIYKEGYGCDIYLLNVDFSFNIIFENTLGGNGIETIHDAYLYDRYIYLVGDTTSSGGYFEGTRKQEDGYLMKVTKDLFNVDNVVISTLNNVNTYSNVTINDDYIYIIEQYTNSENVLYKVKTYNLDLSIAYVNNFVNSHALTPIKFVSKDEGVFLLCYQYNYLLEEYASRIYQISEDANITLSYDYTNYEDENIRIIDLNFNSQQMILLTYDYNLKNVKLIIKDFTTKLLTTLCIDTNEPLSFTSDNAFITTNHKMIDYIYVKHQDNEHMFINNNIFALSDKSIINTDKSIFGKYLNIFVYEAEDLTFAYGNEEYVPINVSILNKETFDKNITLTFNGVGFLNGKEIGNGYIIDNIGTYQLEVFGKENERKIYEFTVDDLSTKEVKFKEVNQILSESKKSESTSNDITLLYGKHLNNDSPKTYFFFLLLIPVILIILSSFLIFRRSHEKKDR